MRGRACVVVGIVGILAFAIMSDVGNAWIFNAPLAPSLDGDRPCCGQIIISPVTNRVLHHQQYHHTSSMLHLSSSSSSVRDDDTVSDTETKNAKDTAKKKRKRRVAIIGAGWAGLSAAHSLSKEEDSRNRIEVTVIEASPRVGGLVRDGFTTISGTRKAEAGQHGFWDNYSNIYRLLNSGEIQDFDVKTALTDYAEQGQYSAASGLEAVWPVYRDQPVNLPTGFAQAAYTHFLNLPWYDRITALPMVLAFSDFDDSEQAWQAYDNVSFRDLCIRLGVSRRCYEEAFEPMILTGLFAPGAECSAAAALGMAYFFVLQSQKAFDVQWCRGNIGQVIFDPWVKTMEKAGVNFQCHTRVTGFEFDEDDTDANKADNMTDAKRRVTKIECTDNDGAKTKREVDDIIFCVGAKALNAFVRFCPELAQFKEFQGFANLRGTSVLATRLFLDQTVTVPYTANACWGFDKSTGMTFFDITAIHGQNATTVAGSPGSVVIEVDYYHASQLLVMSDEDIVAKVKSDLDTILGPTCESASVVDAAIVRLPDAVNWYFPGSYNDMPSLKSKTVSNIYFAGDIVRTRHGSWSQEKAFVTGIEAANLLMKKPVNEGVLPVAEDEIHVKLGRDVVSTFKKLIAGTDNKTGRGPSLVDFFW